MDEAGTSVARVPESPASASCDEENGALIVRSAQDPQAFGVIFDRHVSEIHRYAARRLGVSLADDIAAETFLIAFRRRQSYDPAFRSAKPWLYGIATNVISRHRKAEARLYRTLARTGVDPVCVSGADDIVARVTATAQRRKLAEALAGISAADRDTLLLLSWAELSYQEIARALDIPTGTVASRINRARRKLRHILDPAAPATSQEGSHHE
jgi:RNA polymerase sigma-70 factor, ECF subfamily